MHTPTYLKCECPHCAQPIEYPQEFAEQKWACPSCENNLIFPKLEPQETKPRGFLSGLIGKYQERRAASIDRSAFKDELLLAVADGVLTEDEVEAIARRKEELGLDEEFLAKHSKALLAAATKTVMADGYCSPEEMESIQLMASNLATKLEEHDGILSQLRRGALKHRLRYQPLPPVVISNLILNPGENAFWSERATLYEQKVISRRYEGGSRGVSIRVAKGLSFRVGNHRGNLVSETGTVPVSSGSLIITSERVAFVGNDKSFSIPHRKLLHVEPALDGIRLSEVNKQKPRMILYSEPNGDLVFEVLSRLVQ
jgi:hypothetical protein